MKKIKNGKKIGLVISCLAVVSLVTVGFSAWIIATNDSTNPQIVNVTVADTIDKSLALTVVEEGKDYDVCFGAKTSDIIGKIRGDSTNPEDLELKVIYSITNENVSTYFDKIEASWTIGGGESNQTALKNVLKDGYIVSPLSINSVDGTPSATKDVLTNGTTTLGTSTDAIYTTVATNGNTYTFTTTLTFKRGAYFNNLNPSEYADTEGAKDVQTVKTALDTLKSASGATINIVLHPVVK